MTEKRTWHNFYQEAAAMHKDNPHNLCKAYAAKAEMHTELVEVLENLQDYATGKRHYSKEDIFLMTKKVLNKAKE